MADLKQIEIEELLKDASRYCLVDVRSPKEYAEFHIPGSISLPLFSDEERAIVGTIYKQKGQESAKRIGLEFVAPKLPDLYKQIAELHGAGLEMVIYCWRGGMRSKSVASFMTMMGIPCLQLKGGIRSFRKKITEDLNHFARLNKPFVIIEGYTGSRKTDMLHKLEEEGYPVINLEELAGHRGSIFGAVGQNPISQKAFECRLWERLMALTDQAPFYIIEAESKRIGRIVLPDFIIEGKRCGIGLFIEYPFEKRVKAIIDEYDPIKHKAEITEAYYNLQKYLKPQLKAQLDEAFLSGDWERFVRLLLTDYYDPRYRHTHEQYERLTIPLHVTSVEEGVSAIKKELDRLFEHESLVTNA
ncbi:tRNA 2-selenouridine(34) synthase MnmH [Tuberibacillus calidus]|jgi:tRNA 2-selenouridine synthase|uniref:tRNA 2-selenouridine(34) synthase MnmH n=1 Tax=Tuberibacillus calidus TaxID=340097 RepID=UPI000424EF03|nr:tRNA 2-selenouridine(34) synthase MnmH [Tuberibacillus calidus]